MNEEYGNKKEEIQRIPNSDLREVVFLCFLTIQIKTFSLVNVSLLFKALQCLIAEKSQDDNVLLVAFAKGDRSAAGNFRNLRPLIYSHLIIDWGTLRMLKMSAQYYKHGKLAK